MQESKKSGVRLCCAQDGQVWATGSWFRHHPLNLSAQEVATHAWLDQFNKIYVLGKNQNAALICSLLSQPNNFHRLHIGTPAAADSAAWQAPTPTTVLTKMGLISGLSASLGGYHRATVADQQMYTLVAAVENGEETEQLSALLRRHPAWPALSFIPAVNLEAAAKLLAAIADPRWFVDTQHPDRSSKLKLYLGLLERNMLTLLRGKATGNQSLLRCYWALQTWIQQTEQLEQQAYHIPENFLLRCCLKQKSKVRGLLRATELFVNFAKTLWLEKLAPSGRTLFVSKYFFEGDHPDTRERLVASFEQHMLALRETCC